MAKSKSLVEQIEALECTQEVKNDLLGALNDHTQELAKHIAQLESEKSEASNKVAELEALLAEEKEKVEDLSVEYPTYKTKAGVYELLVPRFIFAGEEIDSKAAVKNVTLMNKIIKAAPGFLRKV